MAEPVEKLHLLFGVAAERVVGCKSGDEFADAGAQLIGEVGVAGPTRASISARIGVELTGEA